MEFHLNYGGPFDVSAAHTELDVDLDLNEIDRMIHQMQAENSLYGEAVAADLFALAGPSEQSSAYPSSLSRPLLLDSPTEPSLTASSRTESPLMPEYEFSADLGPLDDSSPIMMLFRDPMDVPPLDMPIDWSMPALGWTDGRPAACDGSGWSWDESLLNDSSSQQQRYNRSRLAQAVLAIPDANTPADSPPQPPTPAASSAAADAVNALACVHCGASFVDRTKLKIHTNKHTKPFRCAAPRCAYATAEKKSLQRHLVAKARWDKDHRLAADAHGLKEVTHRCPNAAQGCTYATIREDNLKRHALTCTAT